VRRWLIKVGGDALACGPRREDGREGDSGGGVVESGSGTTGGEG
jgi:hypothetical protein